MKVLKQLLRQPMKTLSGIILMSLAIAVLCVCIGQSFAARTTAESLNYRFTTVAIPAVFQQREALSYIASPALETDLRTWLEKTAEESPEVVKGVMKQGILSANIPELTPLNYTQGEYIPNAAEIVSGNYDFYSFVLNSGNENFHFWEPDPYGTPYSCAMLVITLDEISEPMPNTEEHTVEKEPQASDFSSYAEYLEYLETVKKETVTTGYTVKMNGTITEVVSLQDGFRDPTGMIARLSMTVPTLEQIEQLELVSGQQYLVYGTDYYDEDWGLRGLMGHKDAGNPIEIEAFDMAQLKILTEEELQEYRGYLPAFPPYARYGDHILTKTDYERVNAISMTLSAPISLLQYEAVRDEAGSLLELKESTSITYTDSAGEKITVDCEEYIRRYTIPTIAKINGSAEAFLKTEEGALWNAAIERDAVNNSAFAVIGVDKLEYMAEFARQRAQIAEGRSFTEEEASSGAHVCVIHEALAAANGLQIGDTITANFYQTDSALPYRSKNQHGSLNPSASLYFDTTPYTETTEYTIVGLYRTSELWCDVAANEYGFSPNTIFVPKASVATDMEFVNSVLFTTLVINNGQLDAFRELASKAGYADRFVYHDQGYSGIAGNFHSYEDLATQVQVVGISVYAVILLLFLLLYPCSQGKAAATMESLGVSVGKRFRHVMLSAVIIMAPATVLGASLGMLLWQSVVGALKASVETAVSLQLEVGTLLLIAFAQFVLSMILSAVISACVTAPRGLSARRAK